LRAAGGPGLPKLRHLGAEARAARLLRREVTEFAPDLLLARAEAFTLAPRRLRGRLPLVIECNSDVVAIHRSTGRRGPVTTALAWGQGALLRGADAAGCVTARLAGLLARRHRLDPARLFAVPNGAWLPPDVPEAATLRRARGVPDDCCLFAFAGNLNRIQGLEGLLHAVSRVGGGSPTAPRVRLWIIGDAPERARLAREARALGMEGRVDLLGGLPEEEAARHLQAAQAVVSPYARADFERAGADSLKALQGLACGRPVLLTAGTEPAEIGVNEAVIAVPEEDPDAWTAAIDRLAAAWQAAGSPLRGWPWPEGAGPGRAWIEAHRTWDHTAAAWEPVFAKALAVAVARGVSCSSAPRSR